MKALSRDVFEHPVELQRYLAAQLVEGRLGLCLGAGVSTGFGLPDWDTLVARLCSRAGIVADPSLDLPRQAELARSKFAETSEYTEAVRASLYAEAHISFENLLGHRLLNAVGALVMHSARGRAGAVVTLNFDDLLERYLEWHGIVVQSICEPNAWMSRADVRVLHPHGFLASDSVEKSADLVFDQSSFMAVVGQDSHPWRQLLLSMLRSHSWLFVGLSGRDDHLDSLMQAAAREHAIRTEGTVFWGVSFADSVRPVAPILNNRGVFEHVLPSYADLPHFLFGIAQRAAEIRREWS